MRERRVDFDDLNVIAETLADEFLRSFRPGDLYRIIALAFTVVTQYTRRHPELRIKSQKRCDLTASYVPALIQFLKPRVGSDDCELLLQRFQAERTQSVIESYIYVSNEFSRGHGGENREGGCCNLL